MHLLEDDVIFVINNIMNFLFCLIMFILILD